VILRIVAAVAGFAFTQPLVVGLYRLGLDPRGVMIALAVIVGVAVLKGGLLRWAALGVVVGFVGFHAALAWVLNEGWKDL
jgi:hypothetical protein